MPCCGRPGFITSPVRWAPISTRISFDSCVIARAPFISPSMSMPTTAANKPREQLAHRLGAEGIAARRVFLPQGHDPNSFFVQGGDAQQFQSLLEAAQP